MKLRRTLVAVFGCLMFLGAVTGARADTLDFTKAGATNILPFKVINLSRVKLTSFGKDMLIGTPRIFREKNRFGIVCESPVGTNGCEEELQMYFFPSAIDLMFKSFGTHTRDSVGVSAFLRPALIGNTVVMSDRPIDFTEAGDIDPLLFADPSPEAVIGSGDVSTPAAATTVPEPWTISLLGIGLAGVGFIRSKKTRTA
jgi:hypothetical protein